MMTKAEKAALDAALRSARVNRALRWSDAPPVRDLPIPTGDQPDTSGWDFNVAAARGFNSNHLCSGAVFRAWSSSVAHSEGAVRARSKSQGGRALYSTRTLALRALRAAIEADTAGLLADIDVEIEKEVMS